jgi:hypothetical protein
MYTRCQLEGRECPSPYIFVTCHKNGTVVLLQCSNMSQGCAILTHLRGAHTDLYEFTVL